MFPSLSNSVKSSSFNPNGHTLPHSAPKNSGVVSDNIFPLWSTKISSDNGCHLFGSVTVGLPAKIGASGSFTGS